MEVKEEIIVGALIWFSHFKKMLIISVNRFRKVWPLLVKLNSEDCMAL